MFQSSGPENPPLLVPAHALRALLPYRGEIMQLLMLFSIHRCLLFGALGKERDRFEQVPETLLPRRFVLCPSPFLLFHV